MNHALGRTVSTFARLSTGLLPTALLASSAACSDDGATTSSSGSPTPDDGSTPPSGGANGVTAACPASSTLIESTEWMSCVAGKTIAGTEPFNATPCELRIGQNGAFEYVRGGAVALTVPEKTQWEGATGTYQYITSDKGLFLASVAPDLPPVEGQPRVTNLNLSFFALDSKNDTIEATYLDGALQRQTYACQVDAL